MTAELEALITPTKALAKAAGAEILVIYRSRETLKIKTKIDATPVTAADLMAHKTIVAGLQTITENLPILSEEAAATDFSIRKQWSRYWLVDPLDGTKEFIYRTDEFTVNIALIENHRPILGVVYIPVTDTIYFAAKGHGAYKQNGDSAIEKIHVRQLSDNIPIVTISRRHRGRLLDKFLKNLAQYQLLVKGSSIKSCLIAESKADVYPCLGVTSEWDIAAAQCIVEEAGGAVFDTALQPVRYNTKESLLNPELFVVGDAKHDWLQYIA